VSAVITRSSVLWVASIAHALASVGDYGNATYALWNVARKETRGRLLLQGTGADTGLYELECRARTAYVKAALAAARRLRRP